MPTIYDLQKYRRLIDSFNPILLFGVIDTIIPMIKKACTLNLILPSNTDRIWECLRSVIRLALHVFCFRFFVFKPLLFYGHLIHGLGLFSRGVIEFYRRWSYTYKFFFSTEIVKWQIGKITKFRASLLKNPRQRKNMARVCYMEQQNVIVNKFLSMQEWWLVRFVHALKAKKVFTAVLILNVNLNNEIIHLVHLGDTVFKIPITSEI